MTQIRNSFLCYIDNVTADDVLLYSDRFFLIQYSLQATLISDLTSRLLSFLIKFHVFIFRLPVFSMSSSDHISIGQGA